MSVWWLRVLLIGLALLASIFMIVPFKRRVTASVLLVPVLFITAFSGYCFWGGFAQWQHYVQRSASQAQAQKMLQSIKSPQELIEKLRAKLDNTSKSAKGWYLLGRLYTGQDDRQNAVNAFLKAYQLHPENEQYAVNYAHSLWIINNQEFTQQITELFIHLLKNNPKQPDALAMLAMNAYLNHAYEEAINYWQRLLKIVPPQSEEALAIRKAIIKAKEHPIRGAGENNAINFKSASL